MLSKLFKAVLVVSMLTLSQFASAAVVNKGALAIDAGDNFNTAGTTGNGRVEIFSLNVTTTSIFGVNLDTFFGSAIGAVIQDPSFNLVGNFSSNLPTETTFTLNPGNYFISISGGPASTGYFLTGYLTAAPVPEPESFAMFLAGLGLVGGIVARRKSKIAA